MYFNFNSSKIHWQKFVGFNILIVPVESMFKDDILKDDI
jgi:hypothetical protein